MAVVRQKRQFGIQPIGVARIGSGDQPIAAAITDAADEIRRRTFNIAVGEAKQRGAEAAAELDIPSITTLEEGTGTPVAMQVAEGMGRYSREAFENVLLKRFENALSDDIKAKQAELMQTLADKPNAPKLFEKAFNEYLSATGENASGYYKQVVVDYGASALEDGRSRLRVAQIARMQAEAKVAKARRAQEFKELAFNQGASGQLTYSQFFKNATGVKSDYSDYEGIGAAEAGEAATVFDEGQQQFAAGRITYLLQNPDVAKESGQIYTYFSTGGSKAIFNILSPEAQDAVRSIEAVSTVENPLDLLKVAANNSSAFTQAEQAGAILTAEEEELEQARRDAITAAMQENEALNKIAQAKVEALENAQKDRATNIDVIFEGELNTDLYASVGEHGSMTQITSVIKDTNQRLAGLQPTIIGSEKFNKIQNQIQSSKEEIGVGLLKRTLKGLNDEQAAALATALGAGDTAVIADLMPSLVFDRFLTTYTSKSYSRYQGIANDWANGKKTTTDKATATSKLILKDQKRMVAGILRDPSKGILEKTNAYNQFVETFSGNAAVASDLVSARADLDALLQTAQNTHNANTYKKASADLVNNAEPSNIASVIATLEDIGQKTNQNPDDILRDAEGALNDVAQQYVTSQSVIFGDDEFSVSQLRLMSEYARTGSVPEGLASVGQGIVDKALDSKHTIFGAEISPDNIALSESLNAAATNRDTAMAKKRTSDNETLFKKNYLEGKPIADAGNPAVQAKAGRVAAQFAGLDSLPTDLFEKPANELTQAEFEALNIIKRNANVLPNQFTESANRLLAGTMATESIPEFIRNTREFLFRETGNGDITISPAAYSALGEKKAAKLETMFMAYSLAPTGREAAYMQEIAQTLREPLKQEVFKEITGYSDAGVMLTNLDVPSYLLDELTPVAQSFVAVFGSDAVDVLEQALDARYTTNPNAYSPFTGGSYVPYDISMYTDDVENFEKGVQQIVKTLDPNLRFEVGSSISIDEFRQENAFFGFQIIKDTIGNKTEEITKSRLQNRVFYGASLSSTPSNPIFQLYQADEFGMVTVIPNSEFNLRTPEIATAMGTVLPPKTTTPPPAVLGTAPDITKEPEAPTVKSPDSRTVISDEEIKMSLTPEQQLTLQDQIERRESIGALKYPPIPTAPIIMPDQDLIKSVSRITGSKSQASEIMRGFNDLGSAPKMRTEITKVINLTEDLPKTQSRDNLLQRLYEIRNSLQGKSRLNE